MTEQEKEILYAAVMKRANQKDTFGVENGMRIVAMGEGVAIYGLLISIMILNKV